MCSGWLLAIVRITHNALILRVATLSTYCNPEYNLAGCHGMASVFVSVWFLCLECSHSLELPVRVVIKPEMEQNQLGRTLVLVVLFLQFLPV